MTDAKTRPLSYLADTALLDQIWASKDSKAVQMLRRQNSNRFLKVQRTIADQKGQTFDHVGAGPNLECC